MTKTRKTRTTTPPNPASSPPMAPSAPPPVRERPDFDVDPFGCLEDMLAKGPQYLERSRQLRFLMSLPARERLRRAAEKQLGLSLESSAAINRVMGVPIETLSGCEHGVELVSVLSQAKYFRSDDDFPF